MTATGDDLLLDGLIASKLMPPVHDPRLIARTAILDAAMKDLPCGRLIAVVAPAGSGKSSLMTQLHAAFDARQTATSWIGLDVEDNDPATFARYFISALHTIKPGFARDELTALGANPVRDYDALFRRLGSRLSALKTPGALFMDDFQHITDLSILRFINLVIAHRQHTFSLVIASRHRLPLQLARQQVSGTVLEIGQDELYFDIGQIGVFLKRYHDIELSERNLETVLELTEGWPVGVQLAALTIRRHRGALDELIGTFSGRNHDLTRYLAESVIHAQPAAVRAFLLTTSPLHRMCAPLCDVTTQTRDGQKMLEYIAHANLFLIPLDHEGRWYRYHHLFAEFLRNEFLNTDPQGYRDACFRAAGWCETNNHPAEAIRYTLNAERFEEAADLIARHVLKASLFQGDHYTVLDWLKHLPPRFHARRPEILLSHAWSSAFSRETAHAMAISQQAIDALSPVEGNHWPLADVDRQRWLLWAYTVQATTKACSDDIDDCLARATELFPQVPADESFLIATLSNCLSYSYFALRDFEHSREFAILAHEHGHQANAAYLSAWGDFLHGLINVELGQLKTAGEFCRRVQRDSQGLGFGQKSYVAGLSSLLETEIAVQQGEFEKAQTAIEVGQAFKEIFGPVEPQLVALRNEARLMVQSGQLDSACSVLQEGQDAALRERHRRLYLSLAMEEVGLRLTAGDVSGASKAMCRMNLPEAITDTGSWTRAKHEECRLLEGRLKLAQGDARSAMRIFTLLQQARRAETAGGFFLSVTTHRAMALWALGYHSEAARQLDRALSFAAEEFHVFPIAAAGKPLLAVLLEMAVRRSGNAPPGLKPRLRLQNWLIAFLSDDHPPPQPTPETVAATAPMVESLTAREIELLRLLRSGLDNKQIAGAVFLSVPTVKWHLHNIYSKLGVGSRGAAVARAEQIGLA